MVTPNDLINRAINIIGDNQPKVIGNPPNCDTSPAGQAANSLYAAAVQTVARQSGWDFSRNEVVLVATGNTPPFPYSFEYLYPTNGVQVRQLIPSTLPDKNNPLPTTWNVGNTMVANVPKKVIWTTEAMGMALFTNQPSEDLWDPLFTETFVRLLASELAMAIASKPQTSSDTLSQAQAFEKVGEMRDS